MAPVVEAVVRLALRRRPKDALVSDDQPSHPKGKDAHQEAE